MLRLFFFSSRGRHTRLCQVTGVQTCALPISSAVRSDRARPHPFRIVVELDLPFRSIHTGAETEARLLRVAASLAQSRHRLDESDGEKWCAARRSRLRAQPATKGPRFPARARCRAGPDTVLPWTSS